MSRPRFLTRVPLQMLQSSNNELFKIHLYPSKKNDDFKGLPWLLNVTIAFLLQFTQNELSSELYFILRIATECFWFQTSHVCKCHNLPFREPLSSKEKPHTCLLSMPLMSVGYTVNTLQTTHISLKSRRLSQSGQCSVPLM